MQELGGADFIVVVAKSREDFVEYRLEELLPFRAAGDAVGSILHITALIYLPLRRQQGSPHRVVGVGGLLPFGFGGESIK